MRNMKQLLLRVTGVTLVASPIFADVRVPTNFPDNTTLATVPPAAWSEPGAAHAPSVNAAGASGGGDMNCDGIVSVGDIGPFVLALTNPAGYAAAYPNCDINHADLNGDGGVSVGDIGALVSRLTALSAYVSNGCLQINGSNDPMHLTLRLRPAASNELELDVGDDGQADYRFARDLFDCIQINAGGGDDVVRIDETNGIFTDTEITTIDGGPGNDQLFGGSGAETFRGGNGDDFIFGDNGADVAFMGSGDDVFQWDPGDGSDTIEGEDGADTMLFFGNNAAENIDISANGPRVRFFRSVGSITMDLDDVENIDFRALGGADNIIVADLVGTDLTGVSLDLRGPNGGGDSSSDAVTVTGTNAADAFGVADESDGVRVFGLQVAVRILFTEAALDNLTLNGLGEDDVIDASSLEAGAVQLTMNGGLGEDVLIGSEGGDLINGGDGDDVALMGAGDDTFVWNPGDDNDIMEGQSGFDKMLFNGANNAELVNIFANGGRVVFTRSVANVIMDMNDIESIDFNALGGADTVTVQDVSGTDLVEINANLESPAGSGAGDAQPDTVIVNGTSGDDVIVLAGNASGTSVLGLAAQVNITGAEATNDRVTINALSGDDAVEGSALASGAIQLTADGGNNNDVLIGGEGNDVLLGGDGDDVLIGGPGLDVLDGGSGDNVLIQD